MNVEELITRLEEGRFGPFIHQHRGKDLPTVAEAVAALRTLRDERDELQAILKRHGFRRCDIPACNCGSWHHIGGFAARFQEIVDALLESDVELNGSTVLDAVRGVLAKRASAQAEVEHHKRMAEEADKYAASWKLNAHEIQAERDSARAEVERHREALERVERTRSTRIGEAAEKMRQIARNALNPTDDVSIPSGEDNGE